MLDAVEAAVAAVVLLVVAGLELCVESVLFVDCAAAFVDTDVAVDLVNVELTAVDDDGDALTEVATLLLPMEEEGSTKAVVVVSGAVLVATTVVAVLVAVGTTTTPATLVVPDEDDDATLSSCTGALAAPLNRPCTVSKALNICPGPVTPSYPPTYHLLPQMRSVPDPSQLSTAAEAVVCIIDWICEVRLGIILVAFHKKRDK